jgi:hypothetical protein
MPEQQRAATSAEHQGKEEEGQSEYKASTWSKVQKGCYPDRMGRTTRVRVRISTGLSAARCPTYHNMVPWYHGTRVRTPVYVRTYTGTYQWYHGTYHGTYVYV